MEAETLAGLFGLGGALVGAAISTGAVIWQQRKTAQEGERTHLLGLSEAAANGVIQITYRIEDHFAGGVPRRGTTDGNQWHRHLKALLRDLESQSLRFPDLKTRQLVRWGHAEILRDPEGVAEEEDWPTARYRDICTHFRTVMGTVIRREPFPDGIWTQFPGAWPPS
ncbi:MULTISPECIES: hypothetical protein [unclassified Streptomyces]|uniref:hypothetical protein n=1 Tax=unclassified Streptomyces TaxID=2593676 RepID=UPI002DD8A1E5|nr:hypothetical protein [Streptomyces sp. NBC_01445]WSE02105.1 hypothetical protein OG574_00880 [Streptomyces sp. NBC_01445]WSE10224.1 hypothetical protein OG574_47130 [Streptomyces sp. NBC_01445]